jgi:hypothetical protein
VLQAFQKPFWQWQVPQIPTHVPDWQSSPGEHSELELPPVLEPPVGVPPLELEPPEPLPPVDGSPPELDPPLKLPPVSFPPVDGSPPLLEPPVLGNELIPPVKTTSAWRSPAAPETSAVSAFVSPAAPALELLLAASKYGPEQPASMATKTNAALMAAPRSCGCGRA